MKKNIFLIFLLQLYFANLVLVSCTKEPAPIAQLPPPASTPQAPLVSIPGTSQIDDQSLDALPGPWTYLGDGKYECDFLIQGDSLLYPKWSYNVNWVYLQYGSHYVQIKNNLAVAVENGILTLGSFRLYFQSTNNQPPLELSSIKINWSLV